MSPFLENSFVWMNGRFVPWKDAHIHVASHVVHYGSSIFEGFRAYETPKGTAVFRLQDHTRRLYNSCKIYRMEVPYHPGRVQPGRRRDDQGQQAEGLLCPAHRLPGIQDPGR